MSAEIILLFVCAMAAIFLKVFVVAPLLWGGLRAIWANEPAAKRFFATVFVTLVVYILLFFVLLYLGNTLGMPMVETMYGVNFVYWVLLPAILYASYRMIVALAVAQSACGKSFVRWLFYGALLALMVLLLAVFPVKQQAVTKRPLLDHLINSSLSPTDNGEKMVAPGIPVTAIRHEVETKPVQLAADHPLFVIDKALDDAVLNMDSEALERYGYRVVEAFAESGYSGEDRFFFSEAVEYGDMDASLLYLLSVEDHIKNTWLTTEKLPTLTDADIDTLEKAIWTTITHGKTSGAARLLPLVGVIENSDTLGMHLYFTLAMDGDPVAETKVRELKRTLPPPVAQQLQEQGSELFEKLLNKRERQGIAL